MEAEPAEEEKSTSSAASSMDLSDDERINNLIDESIGWAKGAIQGMSNLVGGGKVDSDSDDSSGDMGPKAKKKGKRTFETVNEPSQVGKMDQYLPKAHPDHALEYFPVDVQQRLRPLPEFERAEGIRVYFRTQYDRLPNPMRRDVVTAEPQERARVLMNCIAELELQDLGL